jgi:nicotinate-nucleotide pyrophosphorylase (carboxylating)
MSLTTAELYALDNLLPLAIAEDVGGDYIDLTSAALIPPDLPGHAAFVVRVPGTLAGLPIARLVCERFDPDLVFTELVADGTVLTGPTPVAEVRGPMHKILTAERTALNFLQRLSGVATQTRRYTQLIADLPVKLLDTRKTTPGWRVLEKYAVRQGGGHNHRMGLYDGVLIKDNHLAALGAQRLSPAEAVRRARAAYAYDPGVSIEVEVDTLAQLAEVLGSDPDIVLLDNMGVDLLRQAVAMRNQRAPKVLLEASGGVTLQTLRGIAETGVDHISVGALTHSAVALDIALDYLP